MWLERLLDRLLVRSPRALGRAGERRAALYYQLRGFRIVGRNVRIGRGEIDLVATRGRLLVFVEVKTRGRGSTGAPVDAVDREKQLQVARLAEEWRRRDRRGDCDVRFDIVALRWNGWTFQLEHYPSAFELRADERRPWRWR